MDMLFTKEAWDTLKAYFEAAYQQLGDLELQGYGRVRMEDGEPVCFEVGIPEQEVSTVKTDATWDQMLAFLQGKIDFRDTKKTKKEIPTWRLWWHTHGRGGYNVTYSGTDEDTIKALAAETGDYMWGLVFHTDTMDSTLYLATRKPVPLYAVLGRAVCELMDVDVPKDISEEVAAKVSKKTWTPPSRLSEWPSYGQYGAYGGNKHADCCPCLVCAQKKTDEAKEAAEIDDADFLACLEGNIGDVE